MMLKITESLSRPSGISIWFRMTRIILFIGRRRYKLNFIIIYLFYYINFLIRENNVIITKI